MPKKTQNEYSLRCILEVEGRHTFGTVFQEIFGYEEVASGASESCGRYKGKFKGHLSLDRLSIILFVLSEAPSPISHEFFRGE